MSIEILQGDALQVLRTLPAESVHCCVTSPPYWGLRDYGVRGQMGLERTPTEFVEKMVQLFREVRRVLHRHGTLWLNLGDSYNAYNANRGKSKGANKNHLDIQPQLPSGHGLAAADLKPKDLVGIPWRVAFALQADGWYLRQDIIWHKPNPMPESVRDRCTKAHEYIFLLTKSDRYFFDAQAIKEPVTGTAHARGRGMTPKSGKALVDPSVKIRPKNNDSFAAAVRGLVTMRNKRSVWTVPTKAFKGAHFATFPPDLIEPCILAGCPEGGTVLDPFFGAGTTGLVAKKHARSCIGIELNPEYIELARERLRVPAEASCP